MTRADTFDELRAAMDGSVLVPGDPDYDGARLIWNGAIDRYPAVVARCTSPADVAEALACARDRGLEVAVRGAGTATGGPPCPSRG